ncbi:MAG: stalk domain-containing protein [Armatimonadetes bacterium]|nr:stalk domain-containing protein [Armatimonadota bacterium]
MYKKKLTRRILSLIVVTTMMTPVLSVAVEAAVATWLSPQPGQKLTMRNVEVAVGYNTQSDLRVTRLELWIDDNLYSKKQLMRPESRGVCSFWWDTSRYADGPHDLLVKIYAGDKLISKVSATGSVGNTRYDLRPPTVKFTNVKAGDVLRGRFNIRLNAEDDSGEAPLVSLLVDHSLKLVKNRPPFNYELDTTSYQDGGHELETYAYDTSGNKSAPSVVKVSFKNNIERPVVASVQVDSNPAPVADDDAGAPIIASDEIVKPEPAKTVPPVIEPVARPSAERAVASVRGSISGKLAPPVAAPRVKAAAPVVSVPKVLAAAPKEVAEPSPEISAPESGGVTRMAMASKPSLRSEKLNGVISPSTGLPAESIGEPESAGAKSVSVPIPAKKLRTSKLEGLTAHAKSAPVSPDVPMTSAQAAAPKAVRMAAAPYVRDANALAASRTAMVCPPPAPRDMRAKLEKRTIPVSGKVKLRDLFNQLGGILFWDAERHTVTVYGADIEIEFKIGSDIAKVNGKELRISSAPQIVGGRTVVDVRVYHEAVAFAGRHQTVGSAKTK